MKTIFHITNKAAWASAQTEGQYAADSLKSEGFIHCSLPRQVIPVANMFCKGATGLLLLQINEEAVLAPVKYEGEDKNKFPHVYGPLNLSAVVGVHDFHEGVDGFSLPEGVSVGGE